MSSKSEERDRDLIALLTAIIWSQQRGNLIDRNKVGEDDADLEEIREAVKFANDCLVETEHFIEDAEDQQEQAVEVMAPKRRNR